MQHLGQALLLWGGHRFRTPHSDQTYQRVSIRHVEKFADLSTVRLLVSGYPARRQAVIVSGQQRIEEIEERSNSLTRFSEQGFQKRVILR